MAQSNILEAFEELPDMVYISLQKYPLTFSDYMTYQT